MARDQFTCQYCGALTGPNAEVDHVVSLAKGGTHDLDNLKTACKPCNQAKVWELESEPRQIEYLDAHAPELLEFDQRAAWGLVKRCEELWTTVHFAVMGDDDGAPTKVEVTKAGEADWSDKSPRFDLIEAHWEAIRQLGTELVQAGELENRYTLEEITSGEARARAGLT